MTGMGTAYELEASDLDYLLRVASPWHRKQVAGFLKTVIRKRREGFRHFDESGAEMSLSELHRRSQAAADTQRRVYNLWMSYAR
jgi:hypothetical protein